MTLTVTGGDYSLSAHSCGTGTLVCRSGAATSGPAYDIFNGIVDMLGTVSYIDEASPGGDLVLTFTNGNATHLYEVVLYWNRDDYGWARPSLVTLSGTQGFVNVSTPGTDDMGSDVFNGPTDPNVRIPADNPNGNVVMFTNIQASTAGSFVITVSSPTAETRGKYLNCMRVRRIQ